MAQIELTHIDMINPSILEIEAFADFIKIMYRLKRLLIISPDLYSVVRWQTDGRQMTDCFSSDICLACIQPDGWPPNIDYRDQQVNWPRDLADYPLTI